jgi:hypothetical protein
MHANDLKFLGAFSTTMLESEIERKFVNFIKAKRGLCLKQNPKWYRGIPDRLVVMPGGCCFFLELKRPGETPTALQLKRLRAILNRGIPAYHADTLEQAISIYEALECKTSNQTHTSRRRRRK